MSSSDVGEALIWIIAIPVILILACAKYYCKKERTTREIDRGIRRYQEQNARETRQTTTTTSNNVVPRIQPPYRPTIYTIENDNTRSINYNTNDIAGLNMPENTGISIAGRNIPPRFSIISDNGLPPSYEEAIKMAPINKTDNDNTNQT